MDDIQVLIALLPLGGQIQHHHHAAVVLAHQLEPGVMELFLQIIQQLLGFLIQVNDHLLALVKEVAEHIQQGHPVIVQVGGDLTVFVEIHGVAGIEQLSHLDVQARHLGELPGGQCGGQLVAVQGLNIRKARDALHPGQLLDIGDQLSFLFIVPCRNDDRQHIGFLEGIFNLLFGKLGLVLTDGSNGVAGIDIVGPV